MPLVRWLAGRDQRAVLGAIAPVVCRLAERQLRVDVHLSATRGHHTTINPPFWAGVATQGAIVLAAGARLRRRLEIANSVGGGLARRSASVHRRYLLSGSMRAARAAARARRD